MARIGRVRSESNMYHVMLRGLDQQQLFYDNEDRQAFLDRMARFKIDDSFDLYCYIHQNPMKIGESVYHWTSYGDYLGTPALIDTEYVLQLLSGDVKEAKKLFSAFVLELVESSSRIPLDNARRIIKDVDAIETIKQVGSVSSPLLLQGLAKDQLNSIIVNLRSKGLSIRQISRLTGLNKGIIQRAK